MNTVVIIEDVLSLPSAWKQVETDDVIGVLLEHFGAWPQSARLYKDSVAMCNDVTPHDEETVAALQSMEGTFYAVVYPKGPAAIIVAVVILVVAVAAMFLFKPKIPTPTMRNTQNTSPNNELSARENEARPNGRIPDICGTVRSTPDMICVPYNQYINHQEVEDCVMCIGRGQYEIHDIKDGETSVYEIDGTTVQAYLPNTNINTGEPYFSIGTELTERPMMASRSNSVNGQVLGAPNFNKFRDTVRCRYPNIVQSEGDTFEEVFEAGDNIVIQDAVKYEETVINDLIYPYDNTSFLTPFTGEDQVSLYNSSNYVVMPTAVFTGPGGVDPETGQETSISYNLSGTYTVSSAEKIGITTQEGFPPQPVIRHYCKVVLDNPASVNATWTKVRQNAGIGGSYTNHTLLGDIIYQLNGAYVVLGVSGTQMTLSDPAAVNPTWNDLQAMPDRQSDPLTPLIYATGVKWIGPFFLESTSRTQAWFNLVASNGLYKDDGKKQRSMNVTVLVEITPVDANNQPIGPPEEFQSTVIGSKTSKATRARTLKAITSFAGRCSVRARRLTPTDLDYEGSVVDEIRWKDLYAMSPLGKANFGNVTILRTRTYATTGALALKARKLNCLVTRQLPRRVSGSDFTPELYSTNSSADIFSFVCLDKYIGNRSKAEVDFDNIYDTVAEIEQYFGTPLAAEFCYTIDSDNLSFEETASMIATVIFCVAYRRGNIIRLSFERKTDRSSLLFNHRNKLPGTELRSITFGYDDQDGVEYKYVSPVDDAILPIYLPEGGGAVNPEKYESIGVRNRVQAHFHACRLWNRMQYRTTSVEFDATQEANLLLVGERILVADNTQGKTQDGEVTGQAGLVVYASQSVSFKSTARYYAFFQLPDGTVESIRVSAGPDFNSMRLAKPPRLPLVVRGDAFARATYMVAEEGQENANAFLVTERDTRDNLTVSLQAINYDDRYYYNDKDFINGLIAVQE